MTNKNKSSIETNDMRYCKFYVDYLRKKFNGVVLSHYHKTSESYCSAINDTLGRLIFNEDARIEFIKKMELACKQELIPISSFEWIKDNERCCYWVWGYLHYSNFYGIEIKLPDDNELINVSTLPSNNDERFEYILEKIDRCQHKKKIAFIDYLKNQWSNVYQTEKNLLKWLDKKNREQCLWAWNYIETHIKKSSVINEVSSIDSDNTLLRLIAPNLNLCRSKELYLSTLAAFDLWDKHKDTKKLFLININKAWNQQKFRESVKNNKKSLNTYISEISKKKLEALTIHHNKKINEIIEIMIDSEFKKLLKK